MQTTTTKILVSLSSSLLQKSILILLYDYFSAYKIIVNETPEKLNNAITNYQPQVLLTDCNIDFTSIASTQISIIGIAVTQSANTFCDAVIHLDNTEETIVNTIKKVLQKFTSFSPSHSDDTLSEREKEILSLIATGYSNKEIASRLFLSPHTVITHRKNITAKLNIKTISGLTLYALLNGLVNLQENQLK